MADSILAVVSRGEVQQLLNSTQTVLEAALQKVGSNSIVFLQALSRYRIQNSPHRSGQKTPSIRSGLQQEQGPVRRNPAVGSIETHVDNLLAIRMLRIPDA